MPLWLEQYEIIKNKISDRLAINRRNYSAVNAAALLGVSRGKVRSWEAGQRPSADDLEKMAQILGLRPAWLLLGKGDPESDNVAPVKAKDRSAVNAKKQIIGDLLFDILALLQVEQDEFAKALRITPAEADDILVSRRKPTWDELLRIHQKYHVDIHFLLTGEGENFAPYDLFTRLCSATGIEMWDISALASACGCEKVNMRVWVELWKKKKDPLFPPEWMQALVESYGLNPGWLYQGKGPSHLSRDEVARVLAQRSGYTVREPVPVMPRAAEEPAGYPAPQKAAGDDTV